MHAIPRQSGATLVVALLMLTVLALLGVSAVTGSTVNLRIVYTMQTQQEAEGAAPAAIEEVISTIASFNSPTTHSFTVAGYDVDVDAPECLGAQPAPGYSATWALAPENTQWEVRAGVDDATTGAWAALRQGVTIIMPSGSCP